MSTLLIIIATIWATCSIIHISKEMASPYYGDFWLFDLILAPIAIVQDIIAEHKEWKRIMGEIKDGEKVN